MGVGQASGQWQYPHPRGRLIIAVPTWQQSAGDVSVGSDTGYRSAGNIN